MPIDQEVLRKKGKDYGDLIRRMHDRQDPDHRNTFDEWMDEIEKEAAVKLDLEIGDVVLTGRYKNKRTVVKSLGTDELGMPTMNGQKLLALRIEKLLPKKMWTSKTLAEDAGVDKEAAKATPEQNVQIHGTMHDFKHGTLQDDKNNPVTNRQHAIFLALSRAGMPRTAKHEGKRIYDKTLGKFEKGELLSRGRPVSTIAHALRLARARSKSAARTYVPKEANEGRSPYLSAIDKHVEDLGIYPMYMDEDGGNASWIEDIGHDSVMELDTRMRAEGWRQEKEAGMREKHNIKMRINVSDSEAAEGVAKILNELKMYGDIGTSREIKIREMGKITRKKVKEAGYRLSTGFDGDGSGRIDKVTKGKDYVECSAENVKYPDDWHGMRDFFNGIKIVLDGGRGAEVFRDYAEEKGGSEQICFIDGDGGEHIKSITYDEQTFIDKEARDEIVKLTYHKSSKKPYRQRSEVLAYDSETGEIVCRIKRSHVGGLYVELPGGGIDKGESPRTAAKREALEEAGITLKNIEQVGRCRWKWPKTHQNAMGTWADLYAGDDTFIFIAEVDTKGKPTSEEGDGWDRLQTRSIDKLRTFLKTHKKEGTMIMQDCRLAALRKLETKITQTSAQLPLTKSASTTTLLNEDTTQESNMHNAAGFMAGYMAKTGHNKEASLNKEARNIEGGQASFLKALFPTMNIYGPGEDITPREISNPHTRETFKLNANEMRTGQDTRKAYS